MHVAVLCSGTQDLRAPNGGLIISRASREDQGHQTASPDGWRRCSEGAAVAGTNLDMRTEVAPLQGWRIDDITMHRSESLRRTLQCTAAASDETSISRIRRRVIACES
jgi:hypothetical protein